jgi:hypothetical protein
MRVSRCLILGMFFRASSKTVEGVEHPKRRFPFWVSEFSAFETIGFDKIIPAAPATDFPKKFLLDNSIVKKFT